jgi:hypothetical protein
MYVYMVGPTISKVSKKEVLKAEFYSLKCHLLGLQVHSDAAREVFPTRVTRGFITLYQTPGKKIWLSLHTLKATCNIRTTVLRSQLTVVFVRHPQLASSQNKAKKLVTSIFVIFVYKN